MEYRKLGSSDLHVSVTGLGGNTFGPPRLGEEMSIKCIQRALDIGVNFVDTSLNYGQGQSELFIGKALEGRRSEMLIATKFNLRQVGDGGVRATITKQCEESLRKLRADHIDLYQGGINSDVPVEDVLAALEELVKAGKVRYIGAMKTVWSAQHHSVASNARAGLGPTMMLSAQPRCAPNMLPSWPIS